MINRIEKERLAALNDRTICVTLTDDHSIETLERRSTTLLHTLVDLEFRYQSLINHWKTNSVFVIFSDLENKREGIDILEKSYVKGVRWDINYHKKFVPVTVDELEDSRETTVLAVHGVPFGANKEELEIHFPRANITSPKIYKGGSVFLNYKSSDHAIQVFFGKYFWSLLLLISDECLSKFRFFWIC